MSFQQRRRVLIYALMGLIAAALSCLIGHAAGNFEREGFERLMLAFGETEKTLEIGAFSHSWNPSAFAGVRIAGAFILASLGSLIGYRLHAVARVLAWLQAFVVCLVSEWALFNFFHISSYPLTYVAALTLGYGGGYVLSLFDRQDRRREAQYYEIMLRNQELRDMRLQMVKQDEVERRILAADLHDQVLNDLKQLRHKFDAYVKEPEPQAKEEIDVLLADAMKEIREVMDSLCPSALEHLGLTAAIEDCARRGGERGGFKTRVRGRVDDDDLAKLSLVEQSLLYRLIQESITNIVKHASATLVRIVIEKENQSLVICVIDNGKGIEPAKLSLDSRGLRYMRQRADLIGATIAWRTGEDGKGTIVEIRFDLSGRSDVESAHG
ncbi:MAG TPA: ATP-binding protein [Candidatus Obscuribacterales bacterium]